MSWLQGPPRDIIVDMSGPKYDPYFAQNTLNVPGMQSLVYWNDFYMRPQPVNIARQVDSIRFQYIFGRPMGNYLNGPRVVSTPQAIPSRFPNPFLPSGAPLNIASYAKAVTAQIMQRRGKV